MVLKADQERVKTLLKDTITLLCKNGLSFKTTFSVEALIGVTLDESDVFLVSINEIVKSDKLLAEEAAAASDSESSEDDYPKRSVKNQKTKNARQHRRSKSPDERPVKRFKSVEHPVMKPEMKSSDDEREEEEKIRRMEQRHRAMMASANIPPHMWDDEDELDDEDLDSMGEPYDDPHSPYPPDMRGHMPNMPHHMQQQQFHGPQKKFQKQQQFPQQQQQPGHSQSKPQQQQHPQQQQQPHTQQGQPAKMKGDMKKDNTGQGGATDPDGSEDIMYIKEEPDSPGAGYRWPSDAEDHGEDESMDPDSMFQEMVHPTAADTSGLPDDQNFSSLSEMELLPVGQQEANSMWVQSAQAGSTSGYQGGQRQGRTSTVTSDGNANPMNNPDAAQNVDDEDSCVFTVYEDEVMPVSNKGALHSTMYFCQICGRSFGSLKTYNVHKNEHRGIYKFNCDDCEQGFSTKFKYEAHVRRYHNGERFTCTTCAKAFMSKAGLQRHKKNFSH